MTSTNYTEASDFEAELQARDERVALKIRKVLAAKREEAAELRHVARLLELQIHDLEKAVAEQRWFDIRFLRSSDIDSLCECSPVNLLED